MNDFVEEEWSNMKDFLQKISVSRVDCTLTDLFYVCLISVNLCWPFYKKMKLFCNLKIV